MKRILSKLVIFTVFLTFMSCGSKPSGVLEKLQGADFGDMEQMSRYYTRGTIAAVKELNAAAPRSEKGEASADKKFAKNARWKIIDEKVEGDRASIRIKYTRHPVENMVGLEIPINMKKEDGLWKVDMEKEMKETVAMINAMKKNSGLFDRLKKHLK